MSVYIAGIDYESIVDAEGVSCVIFFSGCRHNCAGCHSPKTHDFNYGKLLDKEYIEEINSEIKKRSFIRSIVLSGGDPMYSAKEILKVLPKIETKGKSLWCYSGFTYEQIIRDKDMYELLSKCNVLVDGKFELENRDISLRFKGSSNQRIIDIAKSIKENKIVLWNE